MIMTATPVAPTALEVSTFTSSALDALSIMDDGNVTVTFKGGRNYNYTVQDPARFQQDANEVIRLGESVGSFINCQIKDGTLQIVTA
jgi:hypothetical protein